MTALAPSPLPSIPVVLPHDPNYQNTMDSIKQHMSACAYKEGKKPDGFRPFILDGTFPEGEIHLPSGETRRIKTTMITAINSHTIDKIDLIRAIKEKRFATLYSEGGVNKILSVHHEWSDRIAKENAWTIGFRVKIDGKYTMHNPDKESGAGIAGIPDESYDNMVNQLGFGAYLIVSKENTPTQTKDLPLPSNNPSDSTKKSPTKEECLIL